MLMVDTLQIYVAKWSHPISKVTMFIVHAVQKMHLPGWSSYESYVTRNTIKVRLIYNFDKCAVVKNYGALKNYSWYLFT